MYSRLSTINSMPHLKDKKVIVRIDSDVDIKDGKITDDTRLVSCLETIDYLIQKGSTVVLVGHLGRPEKQYEVLDFPSTIPVYLKKFSLEPVALWFEEKFKGNLQDIKYDSFSGWKITDNLFLLENIRFYKGEEENDARFAASLAKIADFYVNEAFAVSHRKNASVSGVTHFLPSFAGLHLDQEISILTRIMENPKRPLVVLIGGAKIETKLPMVEQMHHIADYVLVGGEIAEQDKVLIKVQHEKIGGQKSMVFVADVKDNLKDVTPKSVENFEQVINIAQTIVWNGPIGEIGEDKKNEEGTKKIAQAIASSHAYKIVGGGDTLAFLSKENLLSKFDFVSTGGGAMLEFLSGKKLPGITPLLKH
ncbi:MAG: hypothetical protein A2857_04295 [Candidatus Levybacteria bacterium RIFCSPHIGHO2_01_FULL_36_15]|nr:MAG: hypothetical protein A2857_04295 [Candidatus Levybacteria bacterium RIFCSPHIGHO2_01_FULL_36_15]OGH37308.1 MAG: hypothetical protein A2905_03570 [Candidatus Levybacteria bacterium RIFCSPLOWO2_01_FULL_36_10]